MCNNCRAIGIFIRELYDVCDVVSPYLRYLRDLAACNMCAFGPLRSP